MLRKEEKKNEENCQNETSAKILYVNIQTYLFKTVQSAKDGTEDAEKKIRTKKNPE